MLFVSIPQTKNVQIERQQPVFTIAIWNYPDDYGQGIDGFRFYENSTGSWLSAPYYTDLGEFYYLHSYDSGYFINWSASVAIKLRVYTVVNATLTNNTDVNIGKNYHRHNVTVLNQYGVTLFSKQNFTYYDGTYFTPEEEIWYEYDVVLNFLPNYGQIYQIIVNYEVYYSESFT